MSESNDSLVFGDIKMGSLIADISDLALLLKASEEYVKGGIVTASLPEGDDLPLNTIVQLTEKVDGTDGNGNEFVAGHYYQYRTSPTTGEAGWYDVSNGITHVKSTGFGYYYIVDSTHIKCIWTDPVDDGNSHEWVKTELYLVYADATGATQHDYLDGETDFNACSQAGGIVITLDDDINLSGCKLVVKYYFEDDSISVVTLHNVASIATNATFKAFQSDWFENDQNNASFIRNKPFMIRRIFCEGDDVYVETDDPNLQNRLHVDANGTIWLDGVESVKIGTIDGSRLNGIDTLTDIAEMTTSDNTVAACRNKINELINSHNNVMAVIRNIVNAVKPARED